MISLQPESQLDVQAALESREWWALASLCVLWHVQ